MAADTPMKCGCAFNRFAADCVAGRRDDNSSGCPACFQSLGGIRFAGLATFVIDDVLRVPNRPTLGVARPMWLGMGCSRYPAVRVLIGEDASVACPSLADRV